MKELNLISPLSGKYLSIENVPDEVFAKKILGDGIGIDPSDNMLKAPCEGRISQVHKSRHALTIENGSGQQVLLHIGINTVNLKGEGFKAFVKEGDVVKAGQNLIEFDSELISKNGMSPISVMLLLNSDKLVGYKFNSTEVLVSGETTLATLELSDHHEINQNVTIITEKAFESVPFIVRLPAGMHARPAGQLAELSKKFQSTIEIIKGGKVASTSSVISVLALEIDVNDEITFVAVGEDCEEAVKAVINFLVQKEEEELETYEKEHKQRDQVVEKQVSDERTLVGVGASEGTVIGQVFILKTEEYDIEEKSNNLELERKKLETSMNNAEKEILALEEKLTDKSKSAIFASHREMLRDPEILQEAVDLIEKNFTAAYSWKNAFENRANRLESLKNELIASRANDVRDIGDRVLRDILGLKKETKQFSDNAILIAKDLTPSDLVQIEESNVLGFCTTTGGATSHVAILARSMGIPAIAGIEERALSLKDGLEVVLDGDLGTLRLEPCENERAEVHKKQEKLSRKKEEALKNANQEARTKDGVRIEVVANIGGTTDAEKAVEIGGEGVGLLRSEFLFLDRDHAPSVKEQFETYQQIANTLGERTFVVRTLDIGGDKALKYLPLPKEENPFLGVRGIRLCLKKESLFREQLEAILKVKTSKPINIMFPMVGQLSELKRAKEILNEEREKVGNPKVNIGIMIEVPSAAIMAEQFAPEVDFFSIGTNDLTQYTLAMDRGHNELAKSVDGLHPAVLNLIRMTVVAAHKFDKWVGVCGGIASDSKAIPVLIGLGVDELSLSIPNIPIIKSMIRQLNKSDCEKLLPEILTAQSGDEVRKLVIKNWPTLY